MADVTFRDFAAAMMQGNLAGAASVLETLLQVSPDQARAASEHFRGRMAEPTFMPKAMGLRTAVTGGDEAQIGALLGECFGLDESARPAAVAALRKRYG